MALQEGVQDYLVKNKFEQELFIRTIRHAIERKKLLQRLEGKSEERFQNLVEKNVDAMIVVDADGLIKFVNKATLDLFGKSLKIYSIHNLDLP